MIKTIYPVFDIQPNYKKSDGDIIFCEKRDKAFFDFFSSFSSLPYGYNPPFLKDSSFYEDCKDYLSIRTPLIAYQSNIKQDYIRTLDKLINTDFNNILFSETGSLAVELALKVFALNNKDPIKIYTIENSYHGIYGLGGGLTIGSNSAHSRLETIARTIKGFNCVYKSIVIEEDLETISDPNHSVLFIEPIQCTSGDLGINKKFISLIKAQQEKGLTLIVDEIQTGYLSTGSFWAHEKYNLKPDIIIFGKKFQVCGCLLKDKYSYLLDKEMPKYFSSTFDANIIDLIRGKYFNKELIKNFTFYQARVRRIQNIFETYLKDFIEINNFRATGLFLAIDFKTTKLRDEVVKKLFELNIICNPTSSNSIRFRANLNTKDVNIYYLINALKSIL